MGGSGTWGDAEATEAVGGGAPDGEALEPGSMLGRYRIEGPIGSGGMGVVVAARDPVLDRRVAIKVMHHEDTVAQQWLRREAQALAQLNDPSIVSVLDVGMIGSRPFIAMEFIDGVSLDTWLRERRRSTREILEVFTAAGRGLAKAHAVDITHCDFKPGNVMLRRGAGETLALREAVRVMDFGLARQALAAEVHETHEETPSLASEFTGFGKVRGTPKYMAPEQFALEAVGPAADQFAFCVALYEALWGSSPFAGDTPAARMAAQSRGTAPRRPTASRTQRGLVDAVLRGLAPQPNDRWPSMHALLDALEPSPRRWRWGAAAMGVVALGGAVAWLSPSDPPCEAMLAPAHALWNDASQQAIGTAFEGTGRSYATDLWSTGRGEVDDWVSRWGETTLAACLARHDSNDAAEHTARLSCLERQLSRLDAVLAGLRGVNEHTVGRALNTIAVLPDPADCRGSMPTPAAAPDPQHLAALDEAYAVVDACWVSSTTGDSLSARDCAGQALALANDLGDDHLSLEARRVHAVAVRNAGDRDQALELTEALYFDAQSVGRHRLAANTALDLAFQHATAQRDPDTARAWLRRTDALQTNDDDRAKRARIEALVARSAGEHEQAVRHAREAVELETRRGTSPRLALALNTLGTVLADAREFGDAQTVYERSLAVHEALQGASHDTVATAHNNLGSVLMQQDQVGEALSHFERALQIRRSILPAEHRQIATATANVGESHARLEQHARALPYFIESADVFEKAEGRDSADHAVMRLRVATTLRALGRLDDARTTLDAALDVVRHKPLESWDRFRAEKELALLEEASGKPELSRAFFEAALERPLRTSDRAEAERELRRLRAE